MNEENSTSVQTVQEVLNNTSDNVQTSTDSSSSITKESSTTVDITPIIDRLDLQKDILVLQTGFIFALLVALLYHLVFRGFSK